MENLAEKIKPAYPDWGLFVIVFILVGIGLLAVASSSHAIAYDDYGDSSFYLNRQLKWALGGFVIMILLMGVNYKVWMRLSPFFYLFSLILLIMVFIPEFGREGNFAKRWIEIMGIRFQPSELFKLAIYLYFPYLLTKEHREKQKNSKRGKDGFEMTVDDYLSRSSQAFEEAAFGQSEDANKKFTQVMILMAVGLFLIVLEPDFSTAAIIVMNIFIIFFLAGMPLKPIMKLTVIAVPVLLLIAILQPYRLARITTFLDPWGVDASKDAYQIIQSLYAFGHGGFWGAGMGNSIQKYFYLPEAHTDFIFSIIAEETGFIGAGFVIFLFVLFFYRSYYLAQRAPDNYSKLVMLALGTMISLQAFINIAITMGVLPVTGMTLPFISYGGTSLLINLTAVGIMLNISRYQVDKNS